MVLSLIYGKQKYAQSQVNFINNGPNLVTFDTMVSEEHKYSSRVTYFPIESGTIISDHILNQPDIIILSGLVTDTPLNIFATFNRSIAAFNALIDIHNRRQIVDVVTGIKVYRNMALVTLDVPCSMTTGQTLTFNLQFQKIIFDSEIQTQNQLNNIQSGVTDNTPRAAVADNNNIPEIQQDPRFSLKDQAESSSNYGIQSLYMIPMGSFSNIVTNLPTIFGLA